MLYHAHTESIAGNSSGGFGVVGLIDCACNPSKFLTPLYKETYLSEFETATDKAIVKMNLGIADLGNLDLIRSELKTEILAELIKGGWGKPSEDDPGEDDPSGGNDGYGFEDFS